MNKFETALAELSDKLNEIDKKYKEYKKYEFLITGNCINGYYDKQLYDSDLSNEENLKAIYSNPKIKLLFKDLKNEKSK